MNQTKSSELIQLILWIVALISTVGSLFFSEVMQFVPCELCWYQRILMYPLVVIYTIAALKKNITVTWPALWLSGIGIFVSMYNYMVQKVPELQELEDSCVIIPCNVIYVNYVVFITIQLMISVALLLLFALNVMLMIQNKEEQKRDEK